MRARGRAVAGGLRIVGLAGTVVGGLLAVASLSEHWAVDGPGEGVAGAESGWSHLGYGATALCVAIAFVIVLAIALTVGPRSRRVTRHAGGAALTILLLALAAVGVAYWMSGLDFSLFSDNDTVRRLDAGPGYQSAAIGLAVATLGMMVLLAGRWEARTRAALRRQDKAAAAAAITD